MNFPATKMINASGVRGKFILLFSLIGKQNE